LALLYSFLSHPKQSSVHYVCTHSVFIFICAFQYSIFSNIIGLSHITVLLFKQKVLVVEISIVFNLLKKQHSFVKVSSQTQFPHPFSSLNCMFERLSYFSNLSYLKTYFNAEIVFINRMWQRGFNDLGTNTNLVEPA